MIHEDHFPALVPVGFGADHAAGYTCAWSRLGGPMDTAQGVVWEQAGGDPFFGHHPCPPQIFSGRAGTKRPPLTSSTSQTLSGTMRRLQPFTWTGEFLCGPHPKRGLSPWGLPCAWWKTQPKIFPLGPVTSQQSSHPTLAKKRLLQPPLPPLLQGRLHLMALVLTGCKKMAPLARNCAEFCVLGSWISDESHRFLVAW